MEPEVLVSPHQRPLQANVNLPRACAFQGGFANELVVFREQYFDLNLSVLRKKKRKRKKDGM